ncbi:hypothetical protein JCM5353_003091 [Sporobolomyces roseus]
MLYGDSVTVRSAGRTHLLAESLVANFNLADFVRTLCAKAEMDTGHVPSLITILERCHHLESLSLSAVYFAKDPPAKLYTTLQTHSQLRSFSYGFHGVESPFESIVPLLSSFRHLKILRLDRVNAMAPDRSVSSFVKRDLPMWGPPPRYDLEELSITTWRSFDTLGWPLQGLDWLLGRTTKLKSFEAIDYVSTAPLQGVFDLLNSRGCAESLQQLVVRDFQDSTSTEPDPVDPNTLSSTFPRLTHLSLMTNSDESSFRIPTPYLRLPPRLRYLSLDEDLFLLWRLIDTIHDETLPTSFRYLRLRGPFPSDPDVRLLRSACLEKGIECEVVRAF